MNLCYLSRQQGRWIVKVDAGADPGRMDSEKSTPVKTRNARGRKEVERRYGPVRFCMLSMRGDGIWSALLNADVPVGLGWIVKSRRRPRLSTHEEGKRQREDTALRGFACCPCGVTISGVYC